MSGHSPTSSDLFAAAASVLEGLSDAGLTHLAPRPNLSECGGLSPENTVDLPFELSFIGGHASTFTGSSGDLFSTILSRGLGLRPNQVLQTTLQDSISRTEFLQQPAKLFVALGQEASQFLLGTSQPLADIQGRLQAVPIAHTQNVAWLLCTDHPADMVRDPSIKAKCWQDLLVGMKHLGLTPPAAK